jgi:hypothetical protein
METESESLESASHSDCYKTTQKHLFAVAVTADDGHDYFFSTAQFLDAQIECNPGIQGDQKRPPERLLVRYATGEIVILGRGLHRLAHPLQRGELESLKPLAARYTGMRPQGGTIISSINVTRKSDL